MRKTKQLKIGPVGQKILLLFLTGLTLSITVSYHQSKYIRIIKAAAREWKEINRRALSRSIKRLYKSRLLDETENRDGSTTIQLTSAGRTKALTYNLDAIKIQDMKKWDKKWRVILFDIPEKHKKARDALTRLLKKIGCYQFQRSVFAHPYECRSEVEFITEFFRVSPYVRFMIVEHIDNELHLKKHFELI